MMLHYTEWKEIMCDPALMEPCITLMFTTKTLEILLYLKCLDVCSSLSGVGVAPWGIASPAVFTCAVSLHGGLDCGHPLLHSDSCLDIYYQTVEIIASRAISLSKMGAICLTGN